MSPFVRCFLCMGCWWISTPLSAAPDRPVAPWLDALAAGKTVFNVRLRHEAVEDAGFSKRAQATTLRTRLSYTTDSTKAWGGGIEFDHVSALGSERFNDTRQGNTSFPVVADPEGTDLNQAYVQYRRHGHQVTAGRQRINLDNQRFVGGVAWRQNEQTFDAFRLRSHLTKDWIADYSYLDRTNRIFGPEAGSPPPTLDSRHHLLNVRWQLNPDQALTSYGYWLHFPDAPQFSSQTLGLSWVGQKTTRQVTWDYRGEIAQQSDYENSPTAFQTTYHVLNLGARVAGYRLGVGHERLGSDAEARVALQTPLATLHLFQGWSDQFLTTPAAGIEDRYVEFSRSVPGVVLSSAWHDFRSDQGNQSYGTELNIQAKTTWAQRYHFTLKYADYQAEDFSRDTQKWWLIAEATF